MVVAKKRLIANQENEKPLKQIKLSNKKVEIESTSDDDENNNIDLENGKEEDEEEENISLDNSENEEEEENNDMDEENEKSENEEEEEEEEEESEEKKLLNKLNNEQVLANRFITTMANSFSQTLKNKKTHIGALRGLYFETINQIKHEVVRELLFKPKSWHMFFRLVKKNIGEISKSESIVEESQQEEENDENNKNKENNEDEQEEVEEEEEEENNFTLKVFKNLLSYNIIGGKESLITQIKKKIEMNHLYRQSISLSLQQDKYSNIIESFFIDKINDEDNSIYDLLDKFIMFSFTLDQIPSNYLNILIEILNSINEDNILLINFEKIYKSLRKFLSISSSLLNKIIKENIKTSSSTTTTSTTSTENNEDPLLIKFFIQLAGYLFKFSLLNSSTSTLNKESYESDYSIVKLLLGKSNYLLKLVSMMTSFDFSNDRYLPKQQQQKDSLISLFLNQFIQESKLSLPPSNSISYLKSRILCERGILVLTKLKDPLLTKLKISSATLPIPESLLQFFKENPTLLIKTHKSMDDAQAIRQLKLDSLLNILNKVEEYLELQKENERKEKEDQDQEDYINDHFVINKVGNNQDVQNNKNNQDDQDEKDLDDSTIENSSKSLLDFLDEEDLNSDDQDEEDN